MLSIFIFCPASAPLAEPPTPPRQCSVYSRQAIRISYSDGTCLDVVDCFFEETNYIGGGAIRLTSVVNLYVTSSSFVGCYAPWSVAWFGYSAYGGAICHDGNSAEILRCCFRQCRSADYGNAIAFNPHAACRVTDCIFFKCKDHDDTSEGGIYNAATQAVSMARLNFSECILSSRDGSCLGAVLYWDEDAGSWTFSECTVVRCSGGSGLDHWALAVPIVELTNFYNNSCSSSDAILSGYEVGFTVDRCIFSGNTAGRELHVFYADSTANKFSVTNCVFSGSLPGGSNYKKTVNNTVGMQTASFAYVYFATTACPTPLPLPTATNSPQATAERSKEATARQTVEATSEQTVQATIEQTVEATSEQTVEATIEQTNEATSEQTVEATSEQTVEGTPEKTIEATPEQTVEATSEQTVEATPEQTVEATPEKTVEETSEQTVEATREQTVEATSEQTVEATIEQTIEATSDETVEATTGPTTADLASLSLFISIASANGAPSASVSSSEILPPGASESPDPSPTPSSTLSSAWRRPSATGGSAIAVVVGSIAGVILLIVAAIVLVLRVSHQKSSVHESGEMEFAVPESLESSMQGNDWDAYVGIDMENPVAPTIDAFCFTQDEGDF
jgi:hypothetical protein